MNRPTKVVGVGYTPGAAAPVVVVKGAGEAAATLLERARAQEGLNVIQDERLVQELYRIPIDGAVGSALFPVMATLLVHVLECDQPSQEPLR